MDPSTMTPQELMIYAGLFNAGFGLVLGLVPLIAGLKKGQSRLGVYGFLTCLVGGAILGLIISMPAMIFFTWTIFRKAAGPAPIKVDQAANGEADNVN